MRILVNSGILLRLLEPTDPQHGSSAVRCVPAGPRRYPRHSAQNAAEFWNVCTRPVTARGGLGLSIADVDRRLRVIARLFRVIPDSPAAYPTWRGLLVAHGVSGVQVHDARLVALMQVHGITHILTLNGADFAR